MALWTRHRDGVTDLSGLVHHHDAGSQQAFALMTGIRLAPGSVIRRR